MCLSYRLAVCCRDWVPKGTEKIHSYLAVSPSNMNISPVRGFRYSWSGASKAPTVATIYLLLYENWGRLWKRELYEKHNGKLRIDTISSQLRISSEYFNSSITTLLSHSAHFFSLIPAHPGSPSLSAITSMCLWRK